MEINDKSLVVCEAANWKVSVGHRDQEEINIKAVLNFQSVQGGIIEEATTSEDAFLQTINFKGTVKEVQVNSNFTFRVDTIIKREIYKDGPVRRIEEEVFHNSSDLLLTTGDFNLVEMSSVRNRGLGRTEAVTPKNVSENTENVGLINHLEIRQIINIDTVLASSIRGTIHLKGIGFI